MPRRDPDRERLVEILAETYGFTLPLRGFQYMAVEQMHRPQIEAILAAGWEPQRPDREALIADMMRLADEWESHGFVEHSGRYYAEELRALTLRSAP